MPIHPGMVEPLADRTRDLYVAAEQQLLGIIARQLAADLDAPGWAVRKLAAVQALRRASQAVVDELGKAVSTEIHDAVAESYNTGHRAAVAELGALSPEQAAQVDHLTPNAADVDRIAQETVDVVTAPHRSILRTVTDRFRRIVSNVAGGIGLGTRTRRQATQDAMQQWADEGIATFTDRSGRRWKLTSYAEMAVRTATGRAAVEGHMRSLAAAGIDLVIVSDSPRECPLCRPWERRVLSIGGPDQPAEVEVEHAIEDGRMITVHVAGNLNSARAAGLQHPNCRHSVSAYTPGVTPVGNAISDPGGYEAGQRQREIERRIRHYKNRAAAAIAPEAKRAANGKVRQWQAAMRDHLAAHPDLQRIPRREQVGGGNLPDRLPPVDRANLAAAKLRAGDERTPGEMSEQELADAMLASQLDAGDRARIEQEIDRRDVEALLARARPGGRLSDDLLTLSDTELGRLLPHLSDDELLRVMAEMDRRDVAARLPGVRAALVGMSDDQLAERSRHATGEELSELAAEAHRRDMLARHFPGGHLVDDLDAVGDDELAWCMQYATTPEMLRIAGEMDRRDAVELPQPAATGDAVDDLLADRQALAVALDPAPPPDEWGRYADDDALDQAEDDTPPEAAEEEHEEGPRITRAQARAMYDEYVYAQYLKAEEDCRGYLLAKKYETQAVSPESLFRGPARIAHARASEELKEWWATHGRMTQAEFIEKATGQRQRWAAGAVINEAEQQNKR
ncbi:phage minor capsid protein [Streptomyces chryseus]